MGQILFVVLSNLKKIESKIKLITFKNSVFEKIYFFYLDMCPSFIDTIKFIGILVNNDITSREINL